MKPNPRRFLLPLLMILCLGAAALMPRTEATTPSVMESAESCSLATPALITWNPKEFECPVCKTKNIFMVWGSYGSYIYQFPSKYHLIFWPYTESAAWYSCKKCRLTLFMGDFDGIPAEKIPELRHTLETTTLPKQPERSEKEVMVNQAFAEAGKVKYDQKDLKPDQNQGYDEYLSHLITEYVEMIRKGEGPRQENPK